jgi:CubicO group peptidase (beta-lactamase class C family)
MGMRMKNVCKWGIIKGSIFGVIYMCACQTIARGPEYIDGIRVLDTTEVIRYRASFETFFDSLLNQRGFSGGILVAKNGTVLYEHYQGDVYGTNATLIDANTPFHVASTSKTFTSTAILQLESKNLLHLDERLTTYWPEFPYPSVTVRHLLNHSSGIPDYAAFLPKFGWDKKNTVTNWDVLDIINLRKPGLVFSTGTKFKYCNTNFVLLALLVEKITGLTFPYFVKENIFDVAGMTDSYILTALNKGDYMPSWNEKGRIYNYEYLDGLYGDKNVFTTCRDLMKYDEAIRAGKLLDPMSYQKAWEPNFRDSKYDEPWEYYGLGWRLKVFDNHLKIPYHNGWWHGNNAVFQRLVADTAVIIVMGNRMNRKIYASAKAANVFRPYYPDSIMQRKVDDTIILEKEPTVDTGVPGGDKTLKNGKKAGETQPAYLINEAKPKASPSS